MNSRGSRPRSIDTRRIAFTMLKSTSSMIGRRDLLEPPCRARGDRALERLPRGVAIERQRAAEEVLGADATRARDWRR